MNALTIIKAVGFLCISTLTGFLLCYYFCLNQCFRDKPTQESNSESIKESNADVKTMYRTRPYKRYSYDGGSVKRSHRFYANDLKFINEIAKSKNVYSSDVVNSMIGYFIENPELINVIASDFKKDKPLPSEKELPKQ